MKKTLALILVAALAACLLAGCGSSSSADSTVSVSSEAAVSSAVSEETSSIVADPTAFTHGTWNGNVWRNDFANLTFTAPEGWQPQDDEEMAFALYNDGQDLLDADGNFTSEKLAEMVFFYDMWAVDANVAQANLKIGFHNLKMDDALGMTGEEYRDLLKERFAADEDQAYTITDCENVTLGGNTYDGFCASFINDDDGVQAVSYYVCPVGDYMVIILFSAINGPTIEEVVANFAA